MSDPNRTGSVLDYIVVTMALAIALAVMATTTAVVWLVMHPPPVPTPAAPARPCTGDDTDPYADYMRASSSAFFASNSAGVSTPASRSAPNWVNMAGRSCAGAGCAFRTGASALAISAACRFARALSLKLVDQKPGLRVIVGPIGSVAECLPTNRRSHDAWSTSDAQHGIAVRVTAVTTLRAWSWWAGAAAGALLLTVGIGVFVLVGWATRKARQLDDPTHPYLPPLKPQPEDEGLSRGRQPHEHR